MPERLPLHSGDIRLSEAIDVIGANQFIEDELKRRIVDVETACNADVITCVSSILQPIDDYIRDCIEDIPNKKPSLLVILETDGGSIETTERIHTTFRHHYPDQVSFLIPNFAMSAGTILAMSGDNIYMDYYSILGPIDPQIGIQGGQTVPALGYLEKYDQLVKKSVSGGLSQAELAFLIEKFDPAALHLFEQARDHSVDLLEKWLVAYKFKNWTRTQTKGRNVTARMKSDRAKEIAKKLNNTKLWRSHGRGLSIQVILRDLNLLVEDFGSDPALGDLNRSVRAYYRLLQDYMRKRGREVAVHSRSSLFAA